MKVTINQLDEEVNRRNADVIIQQLKKENNQLHQLVNKYHETKNVSRVSVGSEIKQVGMMLSLCIWLCIFLLYFAPVMKILYSYMVQKH